MTTILLSWTGKSLDCGKDTLNKLYNGIQFGDYILAPGFIFAEFVEYDIDNVKFVFLNVDTKSVRKMYFVQIFRSKLLYELLRKRFFKREPKLNNDAFLQSSFILFCTFKGPNIDEMFKDIMLQCSPISRSMIGNPMITYSTPFTRPIMFNTVCRGILSNILENVLLILDVNLTDSCAGGTIYNENRQLIGMVLSTINRSTGNSTNFTLGVSLYVVLSEYLNQAIVSSPSSDLSHTSGIFQNVMESTVVVLVGTLRGTGIIVDCEQGIILTCAHVVNFKLGNVTISHHAKKKKLPGKVIYTSPIGEPFDLAVIKVTYEESGGVNFSSQLFTNVVAPLNIGEPVYTLGFPLYPSSHEPAFSYGNIGTFFNDRSILITCNTIPGTSGGPAIRPNGELIGMVRASVGEKTENGIRRWCHYGVATSSDVFFQPISDFLKTGDRSELQRLTVVKTTAKKKALLTSKL